MGSWVHNFFERMRYKELKQTLYSFKWIINQLNR